MIDNIKRPRSSDDSKLQRDSKRAKISPLDKLSLARRHTIFFPKVEDPNSPISLPGDHSQKHGDRDRDQQNRVAEEQKEYKANSGTADQSLTQTYVERVSQAEMSRREGFVSEMDSTGTPERDLFGKSLMQRAKETVGWSWQTLSEKSLTRCAKETVEWTWQNGVKSFSAKKFMRYLVMYLAASHMFKADAVKIYGKNGCSIDSHLIIHGDSPEYNNARRIVEARFEKTFPKLVERYAKDPCDKKYEKIRVTFDPNLKSNGEKVLAKVPASDPTHVYFRPVESEYTKLGTTLGSTALHEFSHVVQDFIIPPPENYPESVVSWVQEVLASYNLFIYGTKQDRKRCQVPPNLEPTYHYGYTEVAGAGFVVWLDKKFPGFVDNINKIAQEKQITWKDIENLARGRSLLEKFTRSRSLPDLWEEYKKINFTAEMSQFIEEQRQKYLGSDQQGKGKEKKDEL
jgi:hypothetical protein